MGYLKQLNIQDAQQEYDYISRVPKDENGFGNDYWGMDREQFLKEALPQLINHTKGLDLPPGFVPESHYMLWDSGEIVGWFRLRHHLSPALEQGAGHIGYSIRQGFRGRGYATEGLGLLIPIAAQIIPEKEIYLRVNRDNPASFRVMMKNGGYLHHEDENCFYVRIPLDTKTSAMAKEV